MKSGTSETGGTEKIPWLFSYRLSRYFHPVHRLSSSPVALDWPHRLSSSLSHLCQPGRFSFSLWLFRQPRYLSSSLLSFQHPHCLSSWPSTCRSWRPRSNRRRLLLLLSESLGVPATLSRERRHCRDCGSGDRRPETPL